MFTNQMNLYLTDNMVSILREEARFSHYIIIIGTIHRIYIVPYSCNFRGTCKDDAKMYLFTK